MSFKKLLNLPDLTGKLPDLTEKTTGLFQGLKTLKKPERYSNRLSYEDLINAESELGRTLFGPIPAGHQREFFEHKKNVWIWHEGWVNELGQEQGVTIRYEVRPEGVFKKTAGKNYQKIEGAELENFRTAARSYLQLVKTKLYC